MLPVNATTQLHKQQFTQLIFHQWHQTRLIQALTFSRANVSESNANPSSDGNNFFFSKSVFFHHCNQHADISSSLTSPLTVRKHSFCIPHSKCAHRQIQGTNESNLIYCWTAVIIILHSSNRPFFLHVLQASLSPNHIIVGAIQDRNLTSHALVSFLSEEENFLPSSIESILCYIICDTSNNFLEQVHFLPFWLEQNSILHIDSFIFITFVIKKILCLCCFPGVKNLLLKILSKLWGQEAQA